MKSKDVNTFYGDLNREEKIELLDSYMESVKYTEKFILGTTKWLSLLVFLYYLLTNKILEEFEISGAKFSKFEFVEKYFPFAVSCLILFYVIAAIHKAECNRNYTILFKHLYLKNINNKNYIEYHTILLLPFGFFKDLQKSQRSCLSQFLSLASFIPIMMLQLLPYFFMYESLKKIYQFYWEEPYIKLVFFSSIWFVFLSIIKFIYYIVNGVIEEISKKC